MITRRIKIEYICDYLGYKKRSREENNNHLETLVKVVNNNYALIC